MISQGTTTPQPTPTPASVREQIKDAKAALETALTRRGELAAKLEVATRPGEKAALRRGLRGVDGQIDRLNAQIARLEAQLAQLEATPVRPPVQPVPPPAQPAPLPAPVDIAPTVHPAAGTTVPPAAGVDHNLMVLGGIATIFVLAPLAFAIAWRIIRRGAPAEARIAKMEATIDAMASDVENVSEGQRFLTDTLVAEPIQTPDREKVRTRR